MKDFEYGDDQFIISKAQTAKAGTDEYLIELEIRRSIKVSSFKPSTKNFYDECLPGVLLHLFLAGNFLSEYDSDLMVIPLLCFYIETSGDLANIFYVQVVKNDCWDVWNSCRTNQLINLSQALLATNEWWGSKGVGDKAHVLKLYPYFWLI